MEQIFSNVKNVCIVLLLLCCLGQLFAAECGDVNGDEVVDIVDALIIAQAYVNLDPANYNPSVADVNADDIVDIVDALLVAQYYVGLIGELNCAPTPTPTPTSGCVEKTFELQAETETTYSDGQVDTKHAGYTGTGFVDIINATGAWLQWSVDVEPATYARCVFTYACAIETRSMDLIVNGNTITNLAFPATGEWTTWVTEEFIVSLDAGPNIIRLTATTGSGGPNIDKMDITLCGDFPTSTPSPTPTPTPSPTSTLCPGCTPYPLEFPKHWHESGGYGTGTEGGLGGTVYKVTNLNASGSGSLVDALSKSGKRLIVFEVGGIIDMNYKLIDIKNGQVTVAGETAPSPGITLSRAGLIASGNDIVVSHITVLMGDKFPGEKDASDIYGDRVVFNHFTVAWAIDENLSMRGAHHVTLYKCLIAEGLSHTYHADGEHSKGSLIYEDTDNLSLVGTLYAHNRMRNPRVGESEIVISNGVVYNWAPGLDHREEPYNYVVSMNNTTMAFEGNVGLSGPESVGEYFLAGHISPFFSTASGDVYMDDNIIIDTLGNDLYMYDKWITPLNERPFWPNGLEVIPAHENLYEVLRTAGARPGDRDKYNDRVLKTVANGNGWILDSQEEVGGYPTIADYPSTSRSLTIPSGAAAQQEWLDAFEDEIAVDREIDLSRLYDLVGSRASDRFNP